MSAAFEPVLPMAAPVVMPHPVSDRAVMAARTEARATGLRMNVIDFSLSGGCGRRYGES
ncbi:hypothetical protein D3C87_1771630 [compost metagenome]